MFLGNRCRDINYIFGCLLGFLKKNCTDATSIALDRGFVAFLLVSSSSLYTDIRACVQSQHLSFHLFPLTIEWLPRGKRFCLCGCTEPYKLKISELFRRKLVSSQSLILGNQSYGEKLPPFVTKTTEDNNIDIRCSAVSDEWCHTATSSCTVTVKLSCDRLIR